MKSEINVMKSLNTHLFFIFGNKWIKGIFQTKGDMVGVTVQEKKD